MLANVEYGCNDFWFRNGTSLGEGGFGKVFQFPFHGIDVAFKEIPIYFGNDRNKAIEQAYDEYDIMNTVSKKPEKGGLMVRISFDQYETGMEELILSPLSCFFMEEVSSQKVWMILVLPKIKTDLEKLKQNYDLSEDNLRSIMEQLFQAMDYMYMVRSIRHQDLKPSNILINYKEDGNGIKDIKVN